MSFRSENTREICNQGARKVDDEICIGAVSASTLGPVVIHAKPKGYVFPLLPVFTKKGEKRAPRTTVFQGAAQIRIMAVAGRGKKVKSHWRMTWSS